MSLQLLSVVIPAYNEESRIGETLVKITAYLDSRDHDYEILVVDDGSTDNTEGVVTDLSASHPKLTYMKNPGNRGKGYSVRSGLLASKGDIALFSDADLSTPIEEIEKLVPPLLNGEYQVTIASRSLPESNLAVHQPWYRENMGRCFNMLVQLLAVPGIRDTQCGFKCYRREVIEPICKRQKLERFSFDVEQLYIARKLGYRIKEVPVTWINSPATKVNAIRDSARMFSDLFRIRRNGWRGYYD
jgi:dolichyl-phosphate beta-glucosyltransferase